MLALDFSFICTLVTTCMLKGYFEVYKGSESSILFKSASEKTIHRT